MLVFRFCLLQSCYKQKGEELSWLVLILCQHITLYGINTESHCIHLVVLLVQAFLLLSHLIKTLREMWVRTYEGGELLADCLL